MQTDSLSSHAPSFTNYSSNNLADIAARVIEECREESEFDDYYEEYGICEDDLEGNLHENNQSSSGRMEEEKIEDGESEFSFANLASEAPSLISADELFSNGQIRPFFPVFDTELYLKNEEDQEIRNMISAAIGKPPAPPVKVRVPLGKLFIEEREASSSASSSFSAEAEDELDGVPSEMYCVWKPVKGEVEESPGRRNKSKSTGMSSSSRRWRFRELIRRSSSDGGKWRS